MTAREIRYPLILLNLGRYSGCIPSHQVPLGGKKVAEEWAKIQTPWHGKNNEKTRTASKATAAYWSNKIFLERKPGWESSNYFCQDAGERVAAKNSIEFYDPRRSRPGSPVFYLRIITDGWPATAPSSFESESIAPFRVIAPPNTFSSRRRHSGEQIRPLAQPLQGHPARGTHPRATQDRPQAHE